MLLFLVGGGLAVGAAALFAAAAKALRGFYTYKYQVPGLAMWLSGTVVMVAIKHVARGSKPRFPECTFTGELKQSVMRCLSAHYMEDILQPENAAYLRGMMETSINQSSGAAAREEGVSTQFFSFNGLEHIWLRAKDSDAIEKKYRVVILYLHGGGFALGCPALYIPMTGYMQHRIREQLAQQLGDDVGVEVLLANYRKAPQFPYPRPPQDAYTMYKYLLDEEKLSPSQIMVMGDSAGGGLTMATLLRARDEDPSLLPAAAILSCPMVDRSYKGDDRHTPYCMLAADGIEAFWNAYLPSKRYDEPSTWGDASPVHCDLSGLPPVYIQAAEFDYLLPHATTLYDKAKKAGLTTWTLEIERHVSHAFTSAPRSDWPTAAQSLDKMSVFAATQLARAVLAQNGNGGKPVESR